MPCGWEGNKSDLDSADVRSYRPISNLSVLSKLLERLDARQLLDHLAVVKLLPELQSPYRAYHSTETAVLKVLADILSALDTGDVAVLTLLDLSAAFDTVDHATLLRRLKVYRYRWQYTGVVHIISQRPHPVSSSPLRQVCFRRLSHPVWSAAGIGPRTDTIPALHSGPTAALERHNLQPHMYADDTQIYVPPCG